MSKVGELKRRFQKLDQERMIELSDLQEIAEYFQPEKASFFEYKSRSAEQRQKIFDSTPEEALGLAAAAMNSLLTPEDSVWLSIMLVLDNAEASTAVKEWLDIVVKKMMEKFNSGDTAFQTSVHEFWLDYLAFATAVFFADEFDGLRYKCIPLSEVRFAENAKGVVDTVFRCFEYSASQILEKWPKGASAEVRRSAEENPDQKFKVVHAVYPRVNYKKGSKKSTDLPIESIYFEQTTEKILSLSGYEESCFMVCRYGKSSGTSWGRGPGHKSLPDVRVLNEMSRSEMIAVDKAADPTTYLPHDFFLTQHDSSGGATNYYRGTGGVGDKVMTIGSDADLVAIRTAIQAKQDAIKRHFLNHKLQMVGGPQKTAEEVREIVRQNYIALGPVAGRLRTEFLEPLIERTFKIMLRNGELPPPPEEIEGKELKIRYISPITRMQKQANADAVREAFGFLAPFAAVAPQIFKNFDFDTMARDTPEMFGFASKYLKSPDQMKKEAAAEQVAAQKQAVMVDQSQQMALAAQAKELRQQ